MIPSLISGSNKSLIELKGFPMERVNLQVIEMEHVMQKMSARTKVELDQGKLNLNQNSIKTNF